MELWKDIVGYEGVYQVSNYGNVRSLNYRGTGKVQLLKLANHRDGYKMVGLCKEGKQRHPKIHRLVAEAFLDTYREDWVVHHKDDNRTNNHLENLECCPQAKNMEYTKGQKRNIKQLSEIDVQKIYLLYNANGYSAVQLSELFGVTKQQILNIANRKSRKLETRQVYDLLSQRILITQNVIFM